MPKTSGPISAANWSKLADEAMGSSDRTRDHEYPSRAEAVADREQLHPQTIRRIVSARAFLYELEVASHKLASALISQPYTAIEPIAKWYRYDVNASLAAAKDLVEGGHTVRSLIAAEKAARAKADLSPSPRAWVSAAIEHILSANPGYSLGSLKAWRASSIDAVLEPTDGEGHQVMVLVLGPFTEKILYERKRLDTLLVSAGLVSLGMQVVIVLPDDVPTLPFTSWVRDRSISGVFVQAIDCSVPRVAG